MKVAFDATRVTGLLDKTVKALPSEIDKALAMTAMQGINIIEDRTSEGRGYLGAFRPYSPAYAKFRSNRGRQITPVNLNFTGRMLSSMASRRVSRGVQEIYFTRAEEARKAYYHNVTGAGKGRITRKFFGFNQNEKSALARFFKSRLLK